jgi:hypothetical protein
MKKVLFFFQLILVSGLTYCQLPAHINDNQSAGYNYVNQNEDDTLVTEAFLSSTVSYHSKDFYQFSVRHDMYNDAKKVWDHVEIQFHLVEKISEEKGPTENSVRYGYKSLSNKATSGLDFDTLIGFVIDEFGHIGQFEYTSYKNGSNESKKCLILLVER